MTEDSKTKKSIIENTIDVLSGEHQCFAPPAELTKTAHIKGIEAYNALYKESIEDPEAFWGSSSDIVTWRKPWTKVWEWDFQKPEIKFYLGGKLNASENCLDRHLQGPTAGKTAILWEGDDGTVRKFTYRELHREVCRFANVLKNKNVKKGDRVTIYLPMIPELAISMLACARIGAIHSIVFGGFSSSSLKERIHDSESTLVVTSDFGMRGGKKIPIKATVDEALSDCPSIKNVIVVSRLGKDVPMVEGRDCWLDTELLSIDDLCVAEEMDAEDPLFILYTSGSTGKPKGVLHTTGGYLVYSALTFKWVFDYRDDDIYFCTADIGWITGHSYIVYGPLTCGATSVLFEGIPTYPDPGRLWDIIDKHKVTTLYTAPTAIRALMKHDDKWVTGHDLSTLRILGSVGEPINPEAWLWYHKLIGGGTLPIVDTWWQTETGGILISPLPGATTLKPGSATKPLFGIKPLILTEAGKEAGINEGGYLVIEKPWPGILRGTYGDPENRRMKEVYFSRFPGYYMAGDSARKDADGDYWIMGRIDDVLNVSGHRLGTAEIESALVSHEAVSEAAVVGFAHDVKGEGIYAFVIYKDGVEPSEALAKNLKDHLCKEISPIARPDKIQFTTGLPKTRSGKIMRRVLRKIALGQTDRLGDISTLANPEIVEELVKKRL
ncbi:Acetyl-CoA synthetase [hydrothermal vent metagenome]|uniref:acetate--CoA ligase n=1 Tax=hydrothermal vent metagenome TaxID=652676 RepID=A0A3B0QZ67_9ZZZZ